MKILTQLFAAGLSFHFSAVGADWILTRNENAQWSDLTPRLRHVGEVRASFGPNHRYLLLRTSRRSSAPKISGIRAIQPVVTYHRQDDWHPRIVRDPLTDGWDPEFYRSWGLHNDGSQGGLVGKDVGAVEAWDISKGEQHFAVAVIDSGIDRLHPDLHENIWSNPNTDDSSGWNFIDQTADVDDEYGHGTFVSGIIGARGGNREGSCGINWRVSLMPLKAMDSFGQIKSHHAIEAIVYAVNHGSKVINASWGGTVFDPALYETIEWAGTHGVLFIAAAGNDSVNNDSDPMRTFPAAFRLPNIISVGAYSRRDKRLSFSNYGKETVHLAAPGEGIFSTLPGGKYGESEGTSFAAPFVSGVAALLWSQEPALDVVAIKDRLLSTSEVIGYYEKEWLSTAGRTHALNALKNIRPPRPVAPTKWTTFQTQIATPNPYPNNYSQTFYITHPGAQHIRVHFSKFKTELKTDTVSVKDRLGNLVYVYSGARGEFWSTDVIGDRVVIDVQTDDAMVAPGFEIDAYQVSR